MSEQDTSAIEAAVRELIEGEIDFHRITLTSGEVGKSWLALMAVWSHPNVSTNFTGMIYIADLMKLGTEQAAWQLLYGIGLPMKYVKGTPPPKS